MKTLLNILWFIFGGLPLAVTYAVAGILSYIFIITIPAGVACFRMAKFVIWPFGRTVARPSHGVRGISTFSNVVWIIIAGIWLAIGHITAAAALAVTIIGIPFAWAYIKLLPVTFFPFGARVVSSDAIPHGWEPIVRL